MFGTTIVTSGVRRNQVKIFKQEIQHLLVGALDIFENLDHDTVTGFEQIMPTTPEESNRAKSSRSTATPPCPAALKQIFTSNYVPAPPRLDLCGDLAEVLELWDNYCIHRQE